MKKKLQLPQITALTKTAESNLFTIEQLELTFSNKEERTYERIKGGGRGAVMIVPFIDNETIILVREYCAGTHSYELGFPKGIIDVGETPGIAANRELKEEIFYGSHCLEPLLEVMLVPSFFNAKMYIYTARNLYEEALPGDEPEPLEIIKWPLHNYKELLQQPDFNEARSIAALMLVIDQWKSK
tara:strand:+ start:671 stop:1225 length:555 start_codon:yes stop_codon:yes gene_type:complete